MENKYPCDVPVEVYDEELGFHTEYHCPYDDYGGSDRCRVCCGLGVDE